MAHAVPIVGAGGHSLCALAQQNICVREMCQHFFSVFSFFALGVVSPLNVTEVILVPPLEFLSGNTQLLCSQEQCLSQTYRRPKDLLDLW